MKLGRCTNCGHIHDLEKRRRCTWCGSDLPSEYLGPPLAAPPVEREAAFDYRWAVVVISMAAALAAVTMITEAFGMKLDPQLWAGCSLVAVMIAGSCGWGLADVDEWTTGELVGRSLLGALVGAGMGVMAIGVLLVAAMVVAFLTCSGW